MKEIGGLSGLVAGPLGCLLAILLVLASLIVIGIGLWALEIAQWK